MSPCPGIALYVQDDDMTTACLALTPQDEPLLHLTIHFSPTYPLTPPHVTIESEVEHLNVNKSNICASILNTEGGYTPAYTLKGICIQLLSLFASDQIEQGNGGTVERRTYASTSKPGIIHLQCEKCGFQDSPAHNETIASASMMITERAPGGVIDAPILVTPPETMGTGRLPDEILLLICDSLSNESLLVAIRAWNGFSRALRDHNSIRTPGTQCFVLNKDPHEVALGVGVAVDRLAIASEFHLLSWPAYSTFGVRRAIQGLKVEFWLPLPISELHWRRVGPAIDDRLKEIHGAAGARGVHSNAMLDERGAGLAELNLLENSRTSDSSSPHSSGEQDVVPSAHVSHRLSTAGTAVSRISFYNGHHGAIFTGGGT